jgi:hypothetical protein
MAISATERRRVGELLYALSRAGAVTEEDAARFLAEWRRAPDSSMGTLWQRARTSRPVYGTGSVGEWLAEATKDGDSDQPVSGGELTGTQLARALGLGSAAYRSWMEVPEVYGADVRWKAALPRLITLVNRGRFPGWSVVDVGPRVFFVRTQGK